MRVRDPVSLSPAPLSPRKLREDVPGVRADRPQSVQSIPRDLLFSRLPPYRREGGEARSEIKSATRYRAAKERALKAIRRLLERLLILTALDVTSFDKIQPAPVRRSFLIISRKYSCPPCFLSFRVEVAAIRYRRPIIPIRKLARRRSRFLHSYNLSSFRGQYQTVKQSILNMQIRRRLVSHPYNVSGDRRFEKRKETRMLRGKGKDRETR